MIPVGIEAELDTSGYCKTSWAWLKKEDTEIDIFLYTQGSQSESVLNINEAYLILKQFLISTL